MRYNSKLLLKSHDDPLIIAHNCSIIDKRFRDEHTNSPKQQENKTQFVGHTVTESPSTPSRRSNFYSSGTKWGRKSSQVEISKLLHHEAGEKERIVEIKTIEFDWVFTTEYAD